MTAASVAAQVGADGLELFLDPHPQLLEEISGIRPEPGGLHVLLEGRGVRSTQRLALSSVGGGLIAALWPAELKVQAEYLYGQRLATPMIARAVERGWTAAASPQLAFRNSAPSQRLYLQPAIEAAEYARRWEAGDLRRVGQYGRDRVSAVLWPWLKERGYVTDSDDATLELFMSRQLGNRPAFLRPGLRLYGRWDREAVEAAGGAHGLVPVIRADVDAILGAAREPLLPANRPRDAEAMTAAGDAEPAIDVAAPAPFAPRLSRREAIPGHVRHEVWRRDQGRCVDCGSRERLEYDHIIAVANGGSNTARNIELRCETCNRRKGANV